MKVDYKRESNKNYLVLEKEIESYENEMICRNKIESFLPAKTVIWDDREYLYFDITAKQPISRAFSKRKIGIKEIEEILFSLDNISEETEKYLLDSEKVLLDPDYIYWDMKEEKLKWIYYPRLSRDSLKELSEFILEKMDNEEDDVVRIAYELYRRARDEDFCPQNMYELIKMSTCQEDEDIDYPSEYDSSLVLKEEKNKNTGRFKSKIKNLFNRKKNEEEWLEEVIEERNDIEIAVLQEYNETTCLVEDKKPLKKLVCKRPGIEDVELKDFPYVLGSRRDSVDIYIPGDSAISRIHSQIIQTNGTVYLCDLNSTNGSYVNSRKIGNEEVPLNSGDELQFGNTKFTFI